MITFERKFLGEYNLEYKPRVYFTCHPDDFSDWFDRITDDVLSVDGNCAIYYTKDMAEVDEEMYTDLQLGRMNLFVIPVTYKLLVDGCRAFERDLTFAKEKNIPILPIVVEPDIDGFYSRPEAFGNMQYLSVFDNESGGNTYNKKLAQRLSDVLVSREKIKEIKDDFSGEIFLSYRKKDRNYADELIRLIHDNPKFRDIAIWYDEFLILGEDEDFEKNIFKELDASELFVLLVTPSLLEDGNYVMRKEYPIARESGKPILPTEVVATDKDELSQKYSDIPEPIDGNDSCVLDERLTAMLNRLSNERNNDAEHDFLMGLAYFDGIYVEINRERAIELITLAAEAGHFEAMRLLQKVYADGIGVAMDYNKAVMLAERLVAYVERELGEDSEEMAFFLNTLYRACKLSGDYIRATEIGKKTYDLCCRLKGELDGNSIVVLCDVANCYIERGKYDEALSLLEDFFSRNGDKIDEKQLDVSLLQYAIAECYEHLGQLNKALPLYEKIYRVCLNNYGNQSKNTLEAQSSLAMCYSTLGEDKKAIELISEAYEIATNVFGEEYMLTLKLRNNLGFCYQNARRFKEALCEFEAVYAAYVEIYGKTHPYTLTLMGNVGSGYGDTGRLKDAIAILEEAYSLWCDAGCALHPAALVCLQSIAGSYMEWKKYSLAIKFFEKAYEGYKSLPFEMLSEIADVTHGLDFLYGQKANLHYEEYLRYLRKGSVFAAQNALWVYEDAKKKHDRYLKEYEEAKARLAASLNN